MSEDPPDPEQELGPYSDLSPDFVRDFVREFARDFAPDFVREFAPDFVREFARDLAPDLARDFAADFAPDLAPAPVLHPVPYPDPSPDSAPAPVSDSAADHPPPYSAAAVLVAELARERPDIVALAECLCLAAGVERPFLRRARLRFLPRSTAGLEADLWFSPLVEAAGDHLLLDPGAATVLRERLARGPRERAEAVRAFTEETHSGAAPLVRWFEQLLWAGLFPTADSGALVGRELRRVLTAVTASGPDADDIGRWALHYLPRLPAGVLRHDDAWRIQVASSERLGLEPPPDPGGDRRPPGATAEARALVHRERLIGVEARSGGVVLTRPPAPTARPLRARGLWRVRLDAVSALTPRPVSAIPVRLEIGERERLELPFTVLQRLDAAGRPVLSVAHPGTALATVIAGGDPDGPGVRYAVLLPDGAIALHDRAGRVTGTLPASGTRRDSLTLSGDGTRLVWIEGDAVHEYSLAEQTGSSTRMPADAGLRMWFAGDTDTELVWVFISGDGLVLGPAAGSVSLLPAAPDARDLWPVRDGSGLTAPTALVALGAAGELSYHARGRNRARRLSRHITAAHARPTRTVAGAREDGTVLLWIRAGGRSRKHRVIGTAPWQVTGVALSDDERWLAAVGGDTRLLVWPTGRDLGPPREIPLAFCADRVHALPDGGWAVSGSGGPTELTCEDGRRHQVTPAREPAPDDLVPDWIREGVLAEVDRSEIPSLFAGDPGGDEGRDQGENQGEDKGRGQGRGRGALPRLAAAGVRVLVVGPYTPPPLDEAGLTADHDEVTALRTEAHRHGVRVVVDLHPGDHGTGTADPARQARLLDCVRRWLDHDADGIRVSAASDIGARELGDLRHLLDGYDGRILVRKSLQAPHAVLLFDLEDMGARGDDCDMVVPSSLATALAGAVRDADLHFYGAQFMDAQSSLDSTGLRARWGHCLPELMAGTQRRLAAAVLLGLPGSPCLPLDLLREPGIAALLELRRGHLALSRGDCRILLYDRPELLGVLRGHGDETVLCLTNSATRPATVPLTPAALHTAGPLRLLDLLDGTTVGCADTAPAEPAVPGLGVRWFLLLPGHGADGPGE
ncbi:hypothetical protein [Streptomyces yaizuensis]|uniref:DUF3459 domain-containing protein n=1 Tax=Streptomyces yaizuensis TaxID=2989713 RepID=A0ABQ5P5R0_9ACTN|nr:hypothetical protein [Streptomyces sp. YSPA8]GLF97923.1 DUF3459 domain-containing protein [Streptomyces sp. YSPA8]